MVMNYDVFHYSMLPGPGLLGPPAVQFLVSWQFGCVLKGHRNMIGFGVNVLSV